jgi:hypothetical protein
MDGSSGRAAQRQAAEEAAAGRQQNPSDLSRKQPDLAIYDIFNGGIFPTLLDGVVVDPAACSYQTVSEARIGGCAASAETTKDTKYGAHARARHYIFQAFGLEVFGAWGPGATRALDRWTAHAVAVGRVNTRSTEGWSAPHFADMTRQWVSVALQRANANVLIASAKNRHHRRSAVWDARESLWSSAADVDASVAVASETEARAPQQQRLLIADVLTRLQSQTANGATGRVLPSMATAVAHMHRFNHFIR